MAHSYSLTATRPSVARTRNIVLWVLQVIAAAALFGAGASKLAGTEQAVALFDAIGIGQWFRFVTGVIEVAGALLLLVPWLAGVGALLLCGVMAGAVLTELFVVGGNPVPPTVLLLLVLAIAYGRRERTLRLLGR
ncbi:MAG: DoxX family protein [Gemmatimonadetes bacterium]|nr:DoxX family protein [Gemmatimonadota bacterium]